MYKLIEKVQSNVKPNQVVKYKEFIDYNYDITSKTIEDELIYEYKTIRSFGAPDKDELIRFLIHTKYSLDDEIACINDKDEQYQNDRIALKNKAILIYEAIK